MIPDVEVEQPHIARRVRQLDRVVSRLSADAADRRKAAGKEILPLYGAPYWLPPSHVLAAAAEAVGQLTGAPAAGTLALRRAIAEKLERENGILVDPDHEVLVTNAAMHGLSLVFTALLDPGDEVVLFAPGFFFDGLIKLAGGLPVSVPTAQENGWRWDVGALARALSPRTKMIVVNSPANPTGYVASEDDLAAIGALAKARDLLIVSDEAYETMVYDGAVHWSIAAVDEARERTISVFSFTKSYALKQWRVGFLAAPARIAAHLLKVLEWNVLACNHVAQAAAQAALQGPQEWVRGTAVRYERCRDLMLAGLDGVPGISYVVPKGAPFLFLDVGGIGVSDEEFACFLLDEFGVLVDPGGPFQSASHVRLPFGGEDDVIAEAARRIGHAAAQIAGTRS